MNTNLNIDHILLNDSKVPWFEIKNTNQQADIIHMSAANGFTATSYLEFLNFFSDQHSITGMDCRGTWAECETPPPSFKMKHFADDLIQAIEQQHHKPIIGMGHSQGGFVTLLAAIKRPDLFSKIVLIEPKEAYNDSVTGIAINNFMIATAFTILINVSLIYRSIIT